MCVNRSESVVSGLINFFHSIYPADPYEGIEQAKFIYFSFDDRQQVYMGVLYFITGNALLKLQVQSPRACINHLYVELYRIIYG